MDSIYDALAKEIKKNNKLDLSFKASTSYCRHCNGSGEGSYDGSVCPTCKGTGESSSPKITRDYGD